MSPPLKPPITANLRAMKEARGITIAEIARQLEVGERLVNAWVSEDETDPSWPNLVKLAALFRVEPHAFYMAPDHIHDTLAAAPPIPARS